MPNDANEVAQKAPFAPRDLAVLRTALQKANEAVVVYRFDLQTRSLVIDYLNEAFSRQTGVSAAEAVGKPPGAFPTFPDGQPAEQRIRAALRKQPAGRLDLISYRQDGSDIWNQVLLRPICDTLGFTTHWLSVEPDVIIPFTREQRLQSENFKLIRLISIARRLSATLDGRELVERFKIGVRQLTGAEAVLYARRGDGDFAMTENLEPAAQRESFQDSLVARAGAGEWDVTDVGRTRAAVPVTPTGGLPHLVIEVRARQRQVLRESDISTVQLLAQYLAVPARNVALYAELNTVRASCLELSKFKGDLIAMLAHDFNGPLTTIIGFAQVLCDEPTRNETDRQSLYTIIQAADRLAHLAADTLALSGLEQNDFSIAFEPVDLVDLVNEVATSLQTRRCVRVSSDLAIAPIQADGSRLRQVFYNVIDNAIKYSAGDPEVHVFIKHTPDELYVDVVDFGIGIPAGESSSLFKRFARGSNARKLGIAGTGFGLYLVKTIVEAHGGHVSTLERHDKGTTIRIALPRFTDRIMQPSTRALTCEAPSQAPSFLNHTLASAGFKVDASTSCKQLFEDLRNNHYDMVVIDVGEIRLSSDEVKRLEHLSVQRSFGVTTISADGHSLSKRFRALLKPFLVKDLLAG